MTWEQQLFALLDDLEGQAETAFSAERDLEVADRARGEYAAVTLADRLMASTGHQVVLRVQGVGQLAGRLARVADGWCLVESGHQEWLVRLAALTAARGLSPRAVPSDAWPVTARLGLGSALRRIAEDGAPCQLRLLDGTVYDVRPIRVGADFLEAATGTLDEMGVYPFAALAAVASQVASGS